MRWIKYLVLLNTFIAPAWPAEGDDLFCQELKIGASRPIQLADRNQTTGLTHWQRVERTGIYSYRLHFQLRFLPFRSEEKIDPGFRERMASCLEEFNPKLQAKDEEGRVWKVELVIDPAESEALTIFVGGKGTNPKARWRTKDFLRPSYLLYPSDISCQSVVHEMLHLGGLVDEYSEGKEFPCRAAGPLSSVMSNEYLALGETTKFALQPAHVRALAYPGCQEKNAKYYHCAQRSYLTGGCHALPECAVDSGWLR